MYEETGINRFRKCQYNHVDEVMLQKHLLCFTYVFLHVI